jgi:hypothetical protein
MAKRQDEIRDPEMDALKSIEGVNTEQITAQINKIKGITEEITPEIKPEIKPEVKPEVKPEIKPEIKNEVSDPEAIRAAMLNEMFGEQYKTVEDFKKANIPASLQELANLRQKNQELESLVKAKPKHQFANDDIAKMNEFVRETGIKDVTVFNRLNAAELANMDDIDALSLLHVIDNPRLAGTSPQEIRGYFERKYNVDKAKVEAGEMTEQELKYNQMDLQVEADKARTKLQDLKAKIKMPETPVEEPEKTTKWTPEIEATQKSAWAKVNEKIGETFSTIPIMLKGGKEPIVNFALPENTKKSILSNATDYVISNQMEVSEANITSVANAMYSDILFSNREEIYHAIFERARSMTEEEILKVYHNPSPKNADKAPVTGQPDSVEAQRQKAYELEASK